LPGVDQSIEAGNAEIHVAACKLLKRLCRAGSLQDLNIQALFREISIALRGVVVRMLAGHEVVEALGNLCWRCRRLTHVKWPIEAYRRSGQKSGKRHAT